MGIEPTEDNPCYPPNRFEACGAHQELISSPACLLYHSIGENQLKRTDISSGISARSPRASSISSLPSGSTSLAVAGKDLPP
jgi:hypothetical protein